jgi:hypothetical protein
MPSIAGQEAISEGAIMPSDFKQAQRMGDLFTSVGATSFVVTNTDINETRIWPLSYHRAIGKRWARKEEAEFTPRSLQSALYLMVDLAARRKPCKLPDGTTVEAGENLIIRPISEKVTFIQLDDLNHEKLERLQPAAFLIHTTSPGNHQAWIAVDGVEGDENAFRRRVKKAVGGADKSPSCATRIAGSENFKEKHAPNFPMVSLVQGIPGRVMTPEQLQSMGLLAEPEPDHAPMQETHSRHDIPLRVSARRASDKWPSWQIELSRAPLKDGKPDRSIADNNWSMIAYSWGHTVEDIAAKLLVVSPKAHEKVYNEKDQGYPLITARKAARFVEENRQRGRSRA